MKANVVIEAEDLLSEAIRLRDDIDGIEPPSWEKTRAYGRASRRVQRRERAVWALRCPVRQ